MTDPEPNKANTPTRSDSVIFKGVTVGGQAEQLVRVRREIAQSEELTRIELLEKEAREKIDALSAKAGAEAEKLIADAKNEADQIRNKARADGDLAAKREALGNMEGLLTNLENEINVLKETRQSFLESNLPGIIDFSCNLAKKILLCEIHAHPRAIAERAMVLLERMPPGAELTLAVSPQDKEIVETYLKETGGTSTHLLTMLKSDPDLKRGSMRFESDNGRIDAGFLTALEEIGSLLKDQAENPGGQACIPGEERDGG